MDMEIQIRLRNLNINDEGVDEVLAEQFDEEFFVSTGVDVIMSIYADKGKIADQTVEVARRLEHSFPHIEIIGIDFDFVSVADIAKRTGVGREGARKWTSREGFPYARAHIDSTNMDLWVWTEVVDWLKKQRGIDTDEALPTYAQMVEIEGFLQQSLSACRYDSTAA